MLLRHLTKRNMGQPNGDQLIAINSPDGHQALAVTSSASKCTKIGRKNNDGRSDDIDSGDSSGGSNSSSHSGGSAKSATGIASSCYKSSAKCKTHGKTASSASSSFLAGTLAATDQVLLKLVQRLASLRSGGSSNSSTGNGNKKSKKSNNKKKKKGDTGGPAEAKSPTIGEYPAGRHPSGSGSEVLSKKPRCEDPTARVQGDVCECCPKLLESSSPSNSGNYRAQIVVLVDDECPDTDPGLRGKAIATSIVQPSSAAGATQGGGEKIDCVSFSELVLDHHQQQRQSSPVAFEGSDCNLVFCEIGGGDGGVGNGTGDDDLTAELAGCDEILLLEQPVFDYCDDDDGDGDVNLIKPVKTISGEECKAGNYDSIMGANVSRSQGKGLTGRRAQSTDNLKSDQTQPYQYHYINNNNNNTHIVGGVKSVPPDLAPGGEFIAGPGEVDETCSDDCAVYQQQLQQLQQQQDQNLTTLNGINHQDRNKFCGSLPNHLDADDACEAIFKQNEFLQTHLKNVLASHQQQQPEYVTVAGGAGGGSSTNMTHQALTSSQQQQQSQSQQQQQPPPTYQQSSPFYSSSSGKGSTISSTALGSSTFRSGSSGGGDRPDIQLKLPLHRTTVDTGYDQGYGSERSPEDELPPPLLLMHEAQYNEILASSQLTQQPPTSVIEPNDLQRFWNYEKAAASLISSGEYSFITKDSVFLVQVPKGTRGLGLSVSGGSDSSAPFPGLIRIKRLFPHQAAWATGMLQPGDILLEANGIPLTGLTNYEALEVLRTAPNYVTLTVCRPQDEQYRKLSPPSEPPKPPLRNALSSEPQSQVQSPQLSSGQLLQFQHIQFSQQQQQQQMMPHYYQQQQQQQQQYVYPPQTLAFVPLDPIQTSFSGEFEIILTKQQGSLGFTLRKEDESVLGHYVRALVRDPALNDGRIKPGDKIVAVNDVPISQMTHEEAVIFLRQSADVVKLRLYRDQAQTPLSAQSPTLPDRTMEGDEFVRGVCSSASTSTVGHGTTASGKPKPNLRPEALNLLTDIAYRKQSATSNSGGGGSGSTSSSVKSSNASPRRLRRGLQQQQQQQAKRSYDNHGFQHSSGETSNYSDSETSTIVSQGDSYHRPHPHLHQLQTAQMVPGGVYHSASCRSCGGAAAALVQENLDESYYCDDEIDAESLYEEGADQQKRPTFLNLAGESGSTPMSSRKPRFQFSVATTNAYELNNLDNEALDAPTVYALHGDPTGVAGGGSGIGPPGSDQFISLPCETFLVACKTENDLNADSTDAIYVKHFAHKSPLYSSVNVPLKDTGSNVSEVVDAVERGGKKSLMKWKGATLTSDEEETPSHSGMVADSMSTSVSGGTVTSSDGTTRDTPDAESSLAATFGTSTTTPTTERELDFNGCGIDGDGNKIFTVELNKGWNSRLGFSLKQDSEGNRTLISAIYSESVAAKDGRLRVGDQLLMVNDESVENMLTSQVIDLLRIIRGSICLRLVRKSDQTAEYTPQEHEDHQEPVNEPPTENNPTNSPTETIDQTEEIIKDAPAE